MIHAHNIEEKIFEYHEGLLDPAQKEELMTYLHEHPEWQRDFAIWAQSRLHPAAVESPAFHHGMLKKSAGAWSWGKSSFFVAAVVSVVAVWYFWPSAKSEESTKPQITAKADSVAATKSEGSIITITDSITVASATSPVEESRTRGKEQGEKQAEVIDSMHTQEKPSAIPLPDLAPITVLPDTAKLEVPPIVEAKPEKLEPKKPAKQQLLAAKDSISSKQKEPEAPSKKEKKKVKHKFTLKPTSDIVPTNSNF